MKRILLLCAVLVSTTALYAQDARENCQPRLVLPTNPPRAYAGGHSVPLSSLPSNCDAPRLVASDRPRLYNFELPKASLDFMDSLRRRLFLSTPETKDGFITTPDGAKIHYLTAGESLVVTEVNHGFGPDKSHRRPAILFVPGWTMPAWIWENQIPYFAKSTRVVAMDPRSQGESSQESEGLYPAARARDIKAVIDQLKLAPVVLVGWSMGVTEIAAYVDQFGTDSLAGLVFVDGHAGADYDPATAPNMWQWVSGLQKDRRKWTEEFVPSMFKKPQPGEYLKRVTQAALHTPTNSAITLFVGFFTSDYRPALAKIDKPTLVLAAGHDASNPWMKYYRDLAQRIPGAKLEQFPGCGHALFVDDPARFNSLLEEFLRHVR